MVHVGQNMFNFVFTTLAGSSPPSSTPSTARPTTPFQDSSERSPLRRRLTRFLMRSGITRRGKEYEGLHGGSHDRRPQMTKDREDES